MTEKKGTIFGYKEVKCLILADIICNEISKMTFFQDSHDLIAPASFDSFCNCPIWRLLNIIVRLILSRFIRNSKWNCKKKITQPYCIRQTIQTWNGCEWKTLNQRSNYCKPVTIPRRLIWYSVAASYLIDWIKCIKQFWIRCNQVIPSR